MPELVDRLTLDWLLEEDNPSVRYFTLRDILELPEDDSRVVLAQKAVMHNGAVPKILSRQKPEGYWGKPEEFYERSKYKGTVWSFILLADLGANGQDERIGRTVDFLLNISQDAQSGGFSCLGSLANGGDREWVIPCLSGNLIWSMLRFGYGHDPRVQQGIEWLAATLRCDDRKTEPPKTWPYLRHTCWGKHTCMMAVVKTVKALAEIPVDNRSASVQTAIDNGKEFILIHHLFKRSHNLEKIAKLSWVDFGFPWFWGTDALEMLLILKQLNCRDERMQDAIDLLLSKQDAQGKWINEHPYHGRMAVTIEQGGQPSKWVTLNALKVLTWVKLMNIA